MKRKEFIECMEVHKFKKYISNKLNESFTKNDINASWKIKKFTSKKSPNNMGVASISIDSNIFSKVNIEKVADLEIAIREALLKANEIYDDKEFEETILEA